VCVQVPHVGEQVKVTPAHGSYEAQRGLYWYGIFKSCAPATVFTPLFGPEPAGDVQVLGLGASWNASPTSPALHFRTHLLNPCVLAVVSGSWGS
jgi:hypothetical protein